MRKQIVIKSILKHIDGIKHELQAIAPEFNVGAGLVSKWVASLEEGVVALGKVMDTVAIPTEPPTIKLKGYTFRIPKRGDVVQSVTGHMMRVNGDPVSELSIWGGKRFCKNNSNTLDR